MWLDAERSGPAAAPGESIAGLRGLPVCGSGITQLARGRPQTAEEADLAQALADDLAQEVIWAVIRALRDGKVQQPAALPGFVLGTSRNLLAERMRDRARNRAEPLTGELETSIPAPAGIACGRPGR